MSIAIEDLGGLKRRFTVEVPPELFEPKVDKELHRIASQARVKGFRRGKMPFSEAKRRFGLAALDKVANDMMPEYVQPVFEESNIDLASRPTVTCETPSLEEPIKFLVEFEIYPEINLSGLKKIKVDKLEAKITPKEINDAIERLRRQKAEWEVVDQPAAKGDRVKLDFKGTINGEAFQGGEATHALVELDGGQWLPDFEKGLIGAQAGQSLEFDVVFPDDYAQDLAGKKALFAVKVHSVESPKLPELDSAFVQSLGIEGEGTIGVLREEVKESLTRDLQKATHDKVKDSVLKALVENHDVPLPESLVEEEIKRLKDQFHHMKQQADPEKLREMAENKVTQSLLLHAVIKQYDIKVDPDRVKDYVSRLSLPGKSQNQLFDWIEKDEKSKQRIEGIVLEEQVMEKLLEEVKVNVKAVDFDTAMKPLST